MIKKEYGFKLQIKSQEIFFKGTIENDPIFKDLHGLDFKDVITFKSIHICDIFKPIDL